MGLRGRRRPSYYGASSFFSVFLLVPMCTVLSLVWTARAVLPRLKRRRPTRLKRRSAEFHRPHHRSPARARRNSSARNGYKYLHSGNKAAQENSQSFEASCMVRLTNRGRESMTNVLNFSFQAQTSAGPERARATGSGLKSIIRPAFLSETLMLRIF